jgi:tRNA threonylcarbamoyladenosine biosynthesis protein TsaB
MSTILAIETSSELASAALLHGDRVFAAESSGVQTHSQTILPMLQTLLAQAGIALGQCDAIAFGAGPGSFTGVRTACGIAQGLAFGAGLPVVPVSTLLAMAQACRDQVAPQQQERDVLCILDARMSEVYWAQYRYADGWQTIVAPVLSAASDVRPQGDVTACGNGLSAYAAAFAHQAFAGSAQPAVMPHATQIAQLARIAFRLGQAVAAHDAQPLYLRNKVALTSAERALKNTQVPA